MKRVKNRVKKDKNALAKEILIQATNMQHEQQWVLQVKQMFWLTFLFREILQNFFHLFFSSLQQWATIWISSWKLTSWTNKMSAICAHSSSCGSMDSGLDFQVDCQMDFQFAKNVNLSSENARGSCQPKTGVVFCQHHHETQVQNTFCSPQASMPRPRGTLF